jgi:hypothetical protein
MKKRILTLPPGQLRPGMVLAIALSVGHGNELLAAGSTLDAAHIDSIRRRALRCVTVEVPDPRADAVIAREIETTEKRLAYIFRGEGSESRSALNRVVLAYRRSQLQ